MTFWGNRLISPCQALQPEHEETKGKEGSGEILLTLMGTGFMEIQGRPVQQQLAYS